MLVGRSVAGRADTVARSNSKPFALLSAGAASYLRAIDPPNQRCRAASQFEFVSVEGMSLETRRLCVRKKNVVSLACQRTFGMRSAEQHIRFERRNRSVRLITDHEDGIRDAVYPKRTIGDAGLFP